MNLSFRHWVLITGILCVILSFLFFGREQDTYTILLLIGLVLSGFSFIVIMIKDNGKGRLIWIGVVIVCILLQQLSASVLISKSFQILISKNQSLFDHANAIMLTKPDGLTYWGFDNKDSQKGFTVQEIKALESLKREAGLTYITKTSTRIFYETYGFLDSRGGVSYFYKDSADNRFTKIKGRWYF